ncbi:DUF4157 domain-containing protein [Deinococcus sp. RM]|uniref:eCIS core domain-containing protein n=1 Tax=Deinococcus sp. RM TaxID=2316359 RepID=UPI000E6904E0|nr:DUF4157 domain-containing protein [Deinococcus sp. RM]
MFEIQGSARAKRLHSTLPRPADVTGPTAASPPAAPLQRFLSTPTRAQTQAAQPVLRAATLQRQEEDRLSIAREGVQQQIGALGQVMPVQRPADLPVPARPVTPSDWVTVMRHRAESVEGQRLDTRTFGEFQTLQRQVAQSLSQGFRMDRGEPAARYATFGEHLATLQRHALSAPVSRVVLGMIPPAERLPLQRATDEALQRMQVQDQAALNFDAVTSLQRQLAELDAEATQPVLHRIQARRGAGNPLPEAIQRHLEQGLNHDLSRVRIHDDAEADKLAKGVNALAFTTGTDIFFQAGRFDPNTRGGLELLAHEVTHTVQQSQGRVGRGIDPDAGLEAEARTMGAKLAQSGPQFGTKHTPRPRAALLAPTTPATPTVQRWGLGDLKKLTGSAAASLKSAVRNVQKATQKRVQKTVARVKKAAAPALRAARQSASQTLRTAQKLRAQVSASITKAGQTAREYGRQTLQNVQTKARAAAQQVRRQATQLRTRAHQLVFRAATTVANTKHRLHHRARAVTGALRQAASVTALHVRDKARAAGQTLKKVATGIVDGIKTQAQRTRLRAQAFRQRVQTRLSTAATVAKTRIADVKTAARARAQSIRRRIGATATRALRTTKGGLGRFLKSRPATALLLGGGAALTAFQAIKQGGASGLWNAAKGKASEAWKWATSTEGKATLARLAVTVGVTAGAALLTGLTGGLAAPLLIMAAGSVAGGALGRLTQNAVMRTDDKYKDKLPLMRGVLDPKTMALDGALGLVMGPGGALAGGIVKGAAGNLGRYALRPAGQGLAQGARRLIGPRIVNQTTRSAASRQAAQRFNIGQRMSLVWKDMKQYNAKLAKETWTDMQQSLYGSAGVAGRATRDIRSLLGGRKALRTRQFTVARDRVAAMDHREVLTLASQLKLPTRFPQDKLRELVAQGLVKTNHRLVARPIAREARKAALRASRQDLARAAFGAPRQRGESMARRVLRGTGNLLTAGPRATYRTILEKDAGWSKAISQGVGTGHLLSSVSNEASKGAALAVKTEALKPDGEQQPVNGQKVMTDAVLNSLGFNPDYLSEKALGAGATDGAKAVNAGAGASGMNDPVQLEDAPQVANP